MNAITKVSPEALAPKLTAQNLLDLIDRLPPVEKLDEGDFTYLGRRAASCLSDLKARKDEFYKTARSKVPEYFHDRFRAQSETPHEATVKSKQWMAGWVSAEPLQDDVFASIVTPDAVWHEMLDRAGPLIEADKPRRAAEKARQAGEQANRQAEQDRRNAELTARLEREAREKREQAKLAYKEVRLAERPFQTIRASSLAGLAVPEIRWLIPRWLPVGYTTLLYGMPGVGKTLLAQMLATSCAAGLRFLGQEVEQCGAFALFCEDDDSVIHNRQFDINAGIGTDFAGLNSLSWSCPVGEDNTLMRFSKSGEPELTDYFGHLREQTLDEGTRLLILDTASVVFGGDPNDRNEVTAFLGALTALAQEIGGAVVLNTHPSQAAMSSGGGLGHSLAWLGSARSVWRLDGRSGQERILTRTKANLASTGEQVRLWMRNGVLDTSAADANAEDVFLALLRQVNGRGEKVSAKDTARNFAPTVFAKETGRGDFTRDALRVAMERLLSSGAVRSETYGKPSQGFTRLVIATGGEED